MPTQKQQQDQILTQIEVVKQFNDFSNISTTNSVDSLLKDLQGKNPIKFKKLSDYQNEANKKIKDSTDNLFKEIIDIATAFVSSSNAVNNNRNVSAATKSPSNSKEVVTDTKLLSTNKLKLYATIALDETLIVAPNIIMNEIKNALFSNEGICGSNASIKIDTMKIRPEEIDFFEMLQIDPKSPTGQIMFEPKIPGTGRIKFNRKLYETFTTPQYDFYSLSQKKLFTLNWDGNNQWWNVSGLTQGLTGWDIYGVVTGQTISFNNFINDYYSSIEYPKLDDVLKKAMLLTLQSDGTNPKLDLAFNDLGRVLTKLFASCNGIGSDDGDKDSLKKQNNPSAMFNENDDDINSYFNFNDIEGIDLDEEDAKLRNVLRFRDCNNFEIPINKQINHDFSYLVHRKPVSEVVDSTLNKAANDAHNKSDGSIPKVNFQLNLLNNYILNLPKALVSSVLGPKIFFPLVLVYKIYKSGINTVLKTKDLMVKLSKLFYKIISDLFWTFLVFFWRQIRRDLLKLLSQVVASIVIHKNKRFLLIITSLISLLKKVLTIGINNCEDLFGLIIFTIKSALGGTTKPDGNLPFPDVPGYILAESYLLPGYSQDRSLMNIIGKMRSAGINTEPLYGVPNDVVPFVKSIIDGHIEEQDENGFVKVSNKPIIIPQAGLAAPIVIPPGALILSGKVF